MDSKKTDTGSRGTLWTLMELYFQPSISKTFLQLETTDYCR